MNTNIYNIRIYKKEGAKILEEDLAFIEDTLFNDDYYSDRKPTSFAAPLICERSTDQAFVEILIEPYKNYEFIDQVEAIHQVGKFDLWIIQMNEATDINTIWNFDGYHSLCLYQFDEIIFAGKTGTEEILKNYFNVSTLPPNQFLHKCDCAYLSTLCFKPIDNKSDLDFKDKLPLKIKENKDIYDPQNPPNNFYSNVRIYCFWKDKESWKNNVDRIEFRFKNKIVREYNNREFQECKMYDSWNNCSDPAYLEYIENRVKNTLL